jgi:hypothetical protein
MARSLTAQTLGSALVPGAVLLSQAALRILDAFPSSATAWYLHLAVFAPLQQVRAAPSPLALLLDRAGTAEFVLLLLLIGAVRIVRFRLGVALLTHLAFAASLLVARAWMMDLHGSVAPGLLLVREGSGTALVALLLAGTGLACILGHLSFIHDILGSPAGRGGEMGRAAGRPGMWGQGNRARAPVLSPATRWGM